MPESVNTRKLIRIIKDLPRPHCEGEIIRVDVKSTKCGDDCVKHICFEASWYSDGVKSWIDWSLIL